MDITLFKKSPKLQPWFYEYLLEHKDAEDMNRVVAEALHHAVKKLRTGTMLKP